MPHRLGPGRKTSADRRPPPPTVNGGFGSGGGFLAGFNSTLQGGRAFPPTATGAPTGTAVPHPAAAARVGGAAAANMGGSMDFDNLLGMAGCARRKPAPPPGGARGQARRRPGGAPMPATREPGHAVGEELVRRVATLGAQVDQWDKVLREISESIFLQVATAMVDLPYYTDQPESLNDLRHPTGTVPAGTKVNIMFPQIQTNTLIYMRLRTCDAKYGSCNVYYLPVGRQNMSNDELWTYLRIKATHLPDGPSSCQFVAGFHMPGTDPPALPVAPGPSAVAAAAAAAPAMPGAAVPEHEAYEEAPEDDLCEADDADNPVWKLF